MPKILIREFDNSKALVTPSNNFTVVVPGYRDPSKDPSGVEIGYGVYELKSQKDFEDYIGHYDANYTSNTTIPVRPDLTTLFANRDGMEKYVRQITLDDFRQENIETYGQVYKYEEVVDVADGKGTNGYLLYTTDDNSITYRLTLVPTSADVQDFETIEDEETGTKVIRSRGSYCKIKAGYEGRKAFIEVPHIGNQIAYNLLGHGYTVLFKELKNHDSATNQLKEASFWSPLKDKSVFNFRYLISGGCYASEVMNQMVQIAKFNNNIELKDAEIIGDANGRGDCIALCDIDETGIDPRESLENIVTKLGTAAKAITADKNAAIFGPRVQYVNDSLIYPASYHYLLCAINSQQRYAEWYAVAGYARGISPVGVTSTTLKLGEIAINTLAPRVINDFTDRAVNLILNERSNYYLWGNRTAATLNATGLIFSHFLNIRQLCTTIKKNLYSACRQFTFDPNSDLLWIDFVNAIRPTLETMKADQGIKGYKISKVVNGPKAALTAKIRIIPIEAVEDFDISISLEDSLSGITVGADEQEAA